MSEIESTGSSEGASASETSQESTTSSAPQASSSAPSAPTGIAALKESIAQKASASPSEKMKEVAAPAAIPSPYTPNFKFKYLDAEANKQVEKEFEDWAKGLIKDKETEEKFQKLYAKAYGLDAAVQTRDKHKTENQSLRSEVQDTKKSLNILSSYVQSNDMHSFFKALKIPEDKVLKYALERVQYREWTPEQRAAYDGQRDSVARAQFLEEQNQSMAEQMQNIAVQTRGSELQQAMSDPQVSQVAKSFDERMGPGAFQNEVIRRGQLYWHQFQKDIPANQAVNEVLQLIGGLPQPAPTPAPVVQQSVISQPGMSLGSNQTPEKAKPVIPNIQGNGASPVKKLPKSIADLKRLRAAMEA